MKTKRSIGITLFGWFFIFISLLWLIALPKAIYSYHKLCAELVGLPKNISSFPKLLHLYSIIYTLIAFLLFFVTGMGILKIKRWAYYIALSIPFIFFMLPIIMDIWLFGPQFVSKPSLFLSVFISFAILFVLMNKDVIKQFNADYVNKKGRRLNPKKYALQLLITVMLMNAIPLTYSLSQFRKYRTIINVKPDKVEYAISDNAFILNNCERRDALNYSLYIPKDWKLGNIYKANSGFSWSLSFVNMEGSDLKAAIMLNNEGFGKLLLPVSKELGFNTPYDFEKRIYYPTLSPVYLLLKIMGNYSNLETIDEAISPNWRGFIRVMEPKAKIIYDGSLYSLKDNKTCGIVIIMVKDNKALTAEQAKSIIASLEFKDFSSNSVSLFEKGKADLANDDFISASLNFMNALYIDGRNPEYAYYLARSLYKDTSDAGRKGRLGSSKSFLEYALKLNPNHQKAKELLVSVDEEIRKTEAKKKD